MTNGNGGKGWIGASATSAAEAQPDRWVVWGTGTKPEGSVDADDIARGIARGSETPWREDRWVVVVEEVDEAAIDELAADDDNIDGYAPYLAPGHYDEASPEPMRGVLRSDVAPRRKVDQPRPT